MTEVRYPKICYNQLLEKSKTNQTQLKYNWALQLQNMLTKINYGWLWQRQSCVVLKENLPKLIATYKQRLEDIDQNRIQHSSYGLHYKECQYMEAEKNDNYLNFKVNINTLRLISQLRLANTTKPKFYIQGAAYELGATEKCTICNLEEN